MPTQQVRDGLVCCVWAVHYHVYYRDNPTATCELNQFIEQRIMEHIKQPRTAPNLASAVQPEVQLCVSISQYAGFLLGAATEDRYKPAAVYALVVLLTSCCLVFPPVISLFSNARSHKSPSSDGCSHHALPQAATDSD